MKAVFLSRYFGLYLVDAQRKEEILKGQTDTDLGSDRMWLESEADEIHSWLIGPIQPLSEDEIRKSVSDALMDIIEKDFEAGVLGNDSQISSDAITRYMQELEESLRRKPAGAPSKRRPLAVTALELWLANPKLSWMGLALKLCPCGGDHTDHCKQRIRQEVIVLKKVLAKYQIPY